MRPGTRRCDPCARARARAATRRPPTRARARWPARTPRPPRPCRPRGGRRARGRAGPARVGASAQRALERLARTRAVEAAQPQPPEALERGGVARGAGDLVLGGVDRLRERAHVLVDARRRAVRRRPVALFADPVAHGARGGRVVARLPVRGRQQSQHRGVARLGVAREDQPPGGEREVALGQRVLRGGHEALDALGARVGRARSRRTAASPPGPCGCPRGTTRAPTAGCRRRRR